MKAKTFLTFYVSFLVLAFSGIGLFQNLEPSRSLELMHVLIMAGIAAIGLYQAYIWIRAGKAGQPPDDEYSLIILRRAATLSFLLSMYSWAVLVYIYAKTSVDAGILFGSGMLVMPVLFAVSWLYFKLRGHA